MVEPDYTAWRLVSDAKSIAQLTDKEVAPIADSLRDAVDYLNQALEKIRRAA